MDAVSWLIVVSLGGLVLGIGLCGVVAWATWE